MIDNILDSNKTLMTAVQLIENSVKRLAVVLSEDKHVIGTLTDGDIRRCLLRGCTLDTLVTDAMNHSPVVAYVNASFFLILKSFLIHTTPLLFAIMSLFI